jgi:transposase InsO family protein
MKVRINRLNKETRTGYKVRWTEDGKRKEAYRATEIDAEAFATEVRERLFGDHEEA